MKTLLVLTVGLVALLCIAAAFNPLKALALVREAGGVFLRFAIRALRWLRDPARNWWKIGCVSFGACFAVAAWYADSQRRELIVVTERCQTVTTTLKTELVTVRTTADLDRADLLTCRTYMATVADGRQDVEAENREALLALEREARQADARAAEWKRRYDAKTPDCTAAAAVLEEKCAAFSDY